MRLWNKAGGAPPPPTLPARGLYGYSRRRWARNSTPAANTSKPRSTRPAGEALGTGTPQIHSFAQPVTASQLSAVHSSLSSQSSGGPALQLPAEHVSAVEHTSSSLHDEPFGSEALQASAPSSHDSLQSASPSGPGQGSPACRLQLPPLQVSAPLQKSASSQEALLAG